MEDVDLTIEQFQNELDLLRAHMDALCKLLNASKVQCESCDAFELVNAHQKRVPVLCDEIVSCATCNLSYCDKHIYAMGMCATCYEKSFPNLK